MWVWRERGKSWYSLAIRRRHDEGPRFLCAAYQRDSFSPAQSFQKSLKRSGDNSVYRTVCWMFLCPM